MMKCALAIGVVSLGLAGCSTQPGDYHYATHTWSSNHGTMVEDPVNHHSVDMKSAVKREYAGETYYFENEDSAKVFDAKPWAYMYVDDQETHRFGSEAY